MSPHRRALEDDSHSWPAHIKQLDVRIDMDRVAALPGSPETLAAFTAARAYLEDATLYAAHLPRRTARDVPVARLPPQHAKQLLDAGIVEEVAPDSVLGRLSAFTQPEPLKIPPRHRIIQNTAEINMYLPPAPAVAFHSIADRCALVHAGSCMLQVDFKAYYTQFQLAPAVRNYYCHRLPTPDGQPLLVRLCVGPTGQSHMVYVAVSTTRHLLSFPKQSAATDDHIDNIAFVGTPAAVRADAQQLVARCGEVGVTINEDTADLDSLIVTAGDWCGLHLDFANKTVALTDKVVQKTRLSWSLRDGWSWRGFAAHIGLLFYSMQVIAVPVAEFFNLLRFVSTVSRGMQAVNDTQWDLPATVWPSALVDLERWTALALKNEPRPVPTARRPDVLVLVDASAYGYGYVALDTTTGQTYTHGARWSAAFVRAHGAEKLRRSTFTEPWAILLMKRHLVPQLGTDPCLRIGTDSVTAAATHRRGYSSRSYDLNAVAAADRTEFPRLRCELIHVAGTANGLADALSRGNVASKDVGHLQASLRRLLGEIPEDHLPRGWESGATANPKP